MADCQFCGRHPAKWMTFRAHEGFVLFRRDITFSGTFCRDCALTAYASARGKTLKGMWFSPASLLLGAVSTVWDSAKLLDLPAEVKDQPWVSHKVACPHCHAANGALAGLTRCFACRKPFTVTSCWHCGTIDCSATTGSVDRLSIRECRACHKATAAFVAVRNWPTLLIACAVRRGRRSGGNCHGRQSDHRRRARGVSELDGNDSRIGPNCLAGLSDTSNSVPLGIQQTTWAAVPSTARWRSSPQSCDFRLRLPA